MNFEKIYLWEEKEGLPYLGAKIAIYVSSATKL